MIYKKKAGQSQMFKSGFGSSISVKRDEEPYMTTLTIQPRSVMEGAKERSLSSKSRQITPEPVLKEDTEKSEST